MATVPNRTVVKIADPEGSNGTASAAVMAVAAAAEVFRPERCALVEIMISEDGVGDEDEHLFL